MSSFCLEPNSQDNSGVACAIADRSQLVRGSTAWTDTNGYSLDLTRFGGVFKAWFQACNCSLPFHHLIELFREDFCKS